MIDAGAREYEAYLAWESHCDQIRMWVAQGHIQAEAGARACEDQGKAAWIQAYLRRQR